MTLPVGSAHGLRLGMVAGEPSGDLLAALLLGGLKQEWPTLEAVGIGGPKMVAQGFDAWWSQEDMAVNGIVEILRHYRRLKAMRDGLEARLLKSRPDLFIGVDVPDFNLGLETHLKSAGIKTVHFVSPSIWAWRGKRIETIRRAVDHVLCIFPFEPALYAKHGVAATYVGHPLADVIPMEVPRAAARDRLGLSTDDEVVAILPGSRRVEIKHLASRFLAAAVLMQRARPRLRFVLPVIRGLRPAIEAVVAQHGPDLRIQLIDGNSHDALAACDVTLIASGTATLEAALFKRPMVIAYNMDWITWQIMRRMNYQPWIGLPNILLREFVVPELLQDDASPERLAAATLDWLDHPERGAAVAARFEALHRQLRCNTARTATDAIQKILNS
ncbi:MAG: lpxB [Rhizobacter sp.]|nr:lpxB [Rhizobacter sp.]